MREKVVIWDFDGTLAWREGMWSGALAEAAARHFPDRDIAAENLRPFLQRGFPWHEPEVTHAARSPEAWWRCLEQVFHGAYLGVGLDESESELLAASVRGIFLDPDSWRIYDDAVPCLERLAREGWRHVILSNHVPELPELVARLSLADHFDSVMSSANIGYEKPHSGAFDTAREELDDHATIVMVGDSYAADIAGAESAGIPAVLVRRHHDAARRFVKSLDSLPEALAALFQEPPSPS